MLLMLVTSRLIRVSVTWLTLRTRHKFAKCDQTLIVSMPGIGSDK